MEKQNLEPIPIPPLQHLREFQVIYLPIVVFVLLLVLIGWLWIRYVAPATIVGEVETVRSRVVSIVAGTVQELQVDRLDSVTNGQPLVIVKVRDDDQLNADLAAAEADLRLMKARMDLDRVRNVSGYSQLRADLELEKLSLEIARIHLIQAEGELERTKKLYDDQLLARGSGTSRNDFGYDVAVRDRDSLRAEVLAREKAVAELEAGANRLQAAGTTDVAEKDSVVERAIATQRERLSRSKENIVLRSPIDGFVSVVNHLPGEKVVAGETILVVSREKSERIVAWVREPVTTRPNVGDEVEVRRAMPGDIQTERNTESAAGDVIRVQRHFFRGPWFRAKVLKVGKQLEQINPTAVPLASTIQRAEFGLPLIVKVPDNVDLIPGEAVQLRVVKRATPPGVN